MHSSTRRPRPFSGRTRPHRMAVACAAALGFASAQAADFTWTGGAGNSASFWDLAANWTPGLPSGNDARLLLGAYDTTLRSGVFDVSSLQGTGQLRVSGGELRLNGGPSSIGVLTMTGGKMHTPGTLTVSDFHWQAGEFSSDPFSDPQSRVVVTGTATFGNGGSKYMGYRTSLELQGRTRWLDGASSVALDGALRLGPAARFEDRAHSGDHDLHLGQFSNAGVYVKSGQGRTTFSMPYGGASFNNTGRFLVQQGSLAMEGAPSGDWRNAGTLQVGRGASLSVSVFRYPPIEQSGTVRVDGQARFSVLWSGMSSTGEWAVGSSGSLVFANDDSDQRSMPIVFTAGRLRNDGSVLFDGGVTRFTGTAALSGSGSVATDHAATLSFSTALNVGRLRAGGVVESPWGPPIWGSVSAPDVNVKELDWGVADLHVPGRIHVAGTATLYGGPQSFTGDETGTWPDYRKVIDGWLALGGNTTWSGETDMVGSGRISVSAGRHFQDQTATGLPTGIGDDRPVQLGVARFDNGGSYLKTGPAATEITGVFSNAGTVRTEAAGRLIFSGGLDNRGLLEARGGRIDVQGPLSQWSAADRRLTGGRYLANGNVIAIDLGSAAGMARNSAHVELRGANARLLNRHGGTDRDALSGLTRNDGALLLLDGAKLSTTAGLENQGRLEVGAGSVLDVDGVYRQSGSRSASWISGLLDADSIELAGGLWGAGTNGGIGSAQLSGSALRLTDSRFDVDIASSSRYDKVSLTGRAFLGGTLYAEFGDNAIAEGVYHVLTASGGLQGSFSVLSNLDPTLYRVSAVYGADRVDLVVTRLAGNLTGASPAALALTAAPVPEPETYGLLLAGLALLSWRTSRRRCWLPGREAKAQSRTDDKARFARSASKVQAAPESR
ncbi:PEP-CTERM sorting domain-containing protein [Aquabacterium sp. A7-Y]|uniref:PEP-CTERM sorting domain-containing protein n=1 Tax=Aquabacterium sp. A7-Y TaxID=1349605 RepID=UPI00223CB957|nr:PEP-CTERM sorting domain-containing protein [Aquabacterium sp. A7-Y]MCW7539381.1 PEP-CTERM sorting domain-containing protein [Aquabacterium sp. A7-Y]